MVFFRIDSVAEVTVFFTQVIFRYYLDQLALFNIQNLVLRPGQNTMALLVEVRFLLKYWSTGVLEKWTPELNVNWFFHYPITPVDWREEERVWKPPQGAVHSRVLWVRIFYFFIWSQIDGGDMNLKWCLPNSQWNVVWTAGSLQISLRTIGVPYSANPDPTSLSISAPLPSLCHLPVPAANFNRMKLW